MLNKIFKLANSARENSFAIENCKKILKTASLLLKTISFYCYYIICNLMMKTVGCKIQGLQR